MLELKPLSKDAISNAHQKARHYRLLNQPWQAESICRDILGTDPDNQEVIYTLILAITDQFDSYTGTSPEYALELASQLADDYQSKYCKGLIFERRAIAAYNRRTARSEYIAYSYFLRAMKHYEKAEQLQSETNNKDPILRWNACVRFINQHKIKPSPEEEYIEPFLDV